MSNETVGVILAAGEGRRMGAISAHFPKPVLPVCNRPLIAKHLEILRDIGVAEAVVVVGHQKELVSSTALRWCPEGMQLHFVEQTERLGIAHALYLTREIVLDRDVVVILGDTHFIVDDPKFALERLNESRNGDRVAGVLSVRSVRDPELIRRECTVRFDFEGRLVDIQEKPAVPFNDLKPCGIYFFSSEIFEAIEMTEPSSLRGEVEITDSIQTLVDMGFVVTSAPTVVWDRNINYPGDILMSNLVELKRGQRKVLIGEGVSIHPDARISTSVIGNRARINAPVKMLRSLVLDDAVLDVHGEYVDAIVFSRFAIGDCLKEEWGDTP